ncbi:MAG: MoaD/ThiS family protein [Defluviitaleaceae bacterium]|nr:MoaD/ThiS family protein [Defluviitaleaceae bacterium]
MEVRLFAAFRDGRGKVVNVDWHEGINGIAIIKSLGLAPSAVAIYLVNGKNSDPGAALSETDVVFLFPPVGGG